MNVKLNIRGGGMSGTEKERAGCREEWDPAAGAKASRDDCNTPEPSRPSGGEGGGGGNGGGNPKPSGGK